MSLPDDAPVPLGTWPSVAALEGRLLARLLRDARSMRLAAEVLELRDLGWAVHSRRETEAAA